ncbi:MAG: hypothetical protein AB1717_00310 [Pseudomonadota bacterium]
MNTPQRNSQGWYCIQGAVDQHKLKCLIDLGHIDKLSITKTPPVTVTVARLLRQLQSVTQLWLWCDVSRIALRHIIQMPGLEILDVLAVKAPGSLSGFEHATSLRAFRANHYLTEQDLLAIARCAPLQELGIQGAKLTRASLQALLELPHLESLDLEGTPFSDNMARLVSRSTTIHTLDLGATNLTRTGLTQLVTMHQLRSLDLWATRTSENDLELLRELPHLEYLSVGGHESSVALDPERVVSLMLSMPSLKRVWLDGVGLSPEQLARLEGRSLMVRATYRE